MQVFFRRSTALVIDQGLQFQQLLLDPFDPLLVQAAAAVAQVLQQAVAGQFLAAQLSLGTEFEQFGIEQVATFQAQGLVRLTAALEDIANFLAARLVAADFGLGPFGAGLGGDDQAVGGDDLALPLAQLVVAFGQQLLKLRQGVVAIALGNWRDSAGLEPFDIALGLADQARRLFQLFLQFQLALLAVLGFAEKRQGAFQGLLERQLFGLRQLAFAQVIQALLHSGRCRRLLGLAQGAGQAQAEQDQGQKTTKGIGHGGLYAAREEKCAEFRGRVPGRDARLRGI